MSTSRSTTSSCELEYNVNDIPPLKVSAISAIQHLLAMIVGVMAPPLVIGSALGLPQQVTSYLVSISLLMAGIGTFVQIRRFGGFIGSGLLSIQASSFAYPVTIISLGGALLTQGHSTDVMLSTITGSLFIAAFTTIIGSRFLHRLGRLITPTVSGLTVALIGISLIKVGMVDFAGGYAAMGNGTFGSLTNLSLGAFVLLTIVACFRSKNNTVRSASILIGMTAGYIAASFLGMVDLAALGNLPLLTLPQPFKFGFFQIDWAAAAVMSLIFLTQILACIGAVSATSVVCGKPLQGKEYTDRLSSSVLADGSMSALSCLFGAFPMTLFVQNNGVIQITRDGSRRSGYLTALMLVLIGLVPVIGGLFVLMPKPVLGGATLVLFGSVAAAGINIISSIKVDRRESMIISIALGVGLGSFMVPDAIANLPNVLQLIFSSPVVSGGITGLLLNLVLPLGDTDSMDEEETTQPVEAHSAA